MYTTYFKIVRASLSNFELFLIMANCLTEVGEPMKKYISEFILFDNLPSSLLFVTFYNESQYELGDINLGSLWVDFGEHAFGKNLSNFKT